jgi:UDP-N-acetylmuramoyl-L-alanyl-D-glutamate--2,6-diaminopimelate ligase
VSSAPDDVRAILEHLREAGVRVIGLGADSRTLSPGEVFLAYPGARADGRRFIGTAIARGAAAVLWERTGFAWDARWRVPNLPADHLRALAGPLAHEVYRRPSEKLWTIGVTGTNGKTSCSQWIAQALAGLGRKTGVIGTLGRGFLDAATGSSDGLDPDPNTTPDAIVLHRTLAGFVQDGAQAAAMEVSSIGLDQGRVDGVRFDAALFTNLSRDHLDYHRGLAAYAAAKLKLFHAPGLRHAVLNLDDALGARIAQSLAGTAVQRVGYSLTRGAGRQAGLERHLEAHDISIGDRGITFALASAWGDARVESALVGRFNVANLLGVLGVLLASGTSLAESVRAVEALRPVPGRMQRIGGGDRPLVVVDYAHSPDALDKVLAAVADVARARNGKLVCVFGCGGERDHGKRPLMGAAASRHADFVVVTSDNPRGEDPDQIIAEILPGVRVAHAVESDRRTAIRLAVGRCASGDVIVVAGKGHEAYQEVAGERLPFSDAAEALAALESTGASRS